MKKMIFVLEDNDIDFELINTVLGDEYLLVRAAHLKAAEMILMEKPKIDLFLVDIVLPDGSGYRFCEQVRKSTNYQSVPVVFLSTRSLPEDKVQGFSVGGDDFVNKPFNAPEFKMRVQSNMARPHLAPVKTIKNDIFHLTPNSREVIRIDENGSTPVALTDKEFHVLQYLAERPDELCARERLMVAVWGAGVHVTPRNVDSIMSRLRKKIPQLRARIINVHGTGYRLLSKPRDQKNDGQAA